MQLRRHRRFETFALSCVTRSYDAGESDPSIHAGFLRSVTPMAAHIFSARVSGESVQKLLERWAEMG